MTVQQTKTNAVSILFTPTSQVNNIYFMVCFISYKYSDIIGKSIISIWVLNVLSNQRDLNLDPFRAKVGPIPLHSYTKKIVLFHRFLRASEKYIYRYILRQIWICVFTCHEVIILFLNYSHVNLLGFIQRQIQANRFLNFLRSLGTVGLKTNFHFTQPL